MVLKEETADVVLFRESVDGESAEQMPRVHCGSEPRRGGGACARGWEWPLEASQLQLWDATSRQQ